MKVQIQGEQVRVTAKSIDDLQAIIQTIKEQDFDFALKRHERVSYSREVSE